jgi:hypothetical protein
MIHFQREPVKLAVSTIGPTGGLSVAASINRLILMSRSITSVKKGQKKGEEAALECPNFV